MGLYKIRSTHSHSSPLCGFLDHSVGCKYRTQLSDNLSVFWQKEEANASGWCQDQLFSSIGKTSVLEGFNNPLTLNRNWFQMARNTMGHTDYVEVRGGEDVRNSFWNALLLLSSSHLFQLTACTLYCLKTNEFNFNFVHFIQRTFHSYIIMASPGWWKETGWSLFALPLFKVHIGVQSFTVTVQLAH